MRTRPKVSREQAVTVQTWVCQFEIKRLGRLRWPMVAGPEDAGLYIVQVTDVPF